MESFASAKTKFERLLYLSLAMSFLLCFSYIIITLTIFKGSVENSDLRSFLVIGILIFIVATALVYLGLNRYVKPAFEPVDEMQIRVAEISQGNLSVKFEEFRSNSVLQGLVANLDNIVARFKNTMEQVEGICSKNVLDEIKLNSEQDEVGKTLNVIIGQIKAIDDAEKQRTWQNQGIANFSHLLRVHSNDTSALYDHSIKELIKYLKANQGGLFIIEGESEDENDPHMLLKGCYAYDRKKFINKRIEKGEGLVGACWAEGETIFLTEIPNDYMYISSGVGGASPACLVIVPIKFNDMIYGVIELASFTIFKDYEIKFIESMAESFGSAVHNAKTNTKTLSLLERSQIFTEELRAQEEEMRQNMEELQATQEEMERNVLSMKSMTRELEIRENIFGLTTILSEADKYGNIIDVNSKLCLVSGYTREELIGKPHNIFRDPEMPKELFKLFWSTIKSGQNFRGIIKNRGKNNVVYWVSATVVPIKDENGEIVKYIGARFHIEDEKIAVIMYNQQAKELGFPILSE